MNGSTGVGNSVVVFSGGSAANNLVDVFNNVIRNKGCSLSYIIPISDNGGSSSELIRVFGGPGIGDVRSRLVRLIPAVYSEERDAIKTLFNYRLPSDRQAARTEWLDVVEARHSLWGCIPSEKKELIRSFLNLLNLEIVKRARPTSVFNFESASIGNMFLTGARLFSGSFESAIYLLSSICAIPENISVLPAVNTNFSHHICAKLSDGTIITGQNSISHPSDPTSVPASATDTGDEIMTSAIHGSREDEIQASRRSIDHADTIEDANWPGSLPVLRKPYISFTKTPPALNDGTSTPDSHTTADTDHAELQRHSDELSHPISRIFYINPYGQEIRPRPNPKIVFAVSGALSIIYSIGSLYTSIIPSLILRDVGEAIRTSDAKQKILILNGSRDRETKSTSQGPYTALDFARAIARAAQESAGVSDAEVEPSDVKSYVTHVIYIEGPGAPAMDRDAMVKAGIETVRVYGRRMDDGYGWKYDEKALTQALEALIGRNDAVSRKSRRNTLVG